MNFRMWTPGRALPQRVTGNAACSHCKGSGEESNKNIGGCGWSHIVCSYCGGTGRKQIVKVDSGSERRSYRR